MSKKGKERTKDKERRVKRLPTVQFEDFSEADRVFRELLAGDEYLPRRAKEEPELPIERSSKKRPKTRGSQHTVDLHGLTLREAIESLDNTVSVMLAALPQPVTLKIVTGKGLHSGPGGGVLAREVHQYVRDRYGPIISRLDASPAETSLGGVPLRGYFTVTFSRRP